MVDNAQLRTEMFQRLKEIRREFLEKGLNEQDIEEVFWEFDDFILDEEV